MLKGVPDYSIAEVDVLGLAIKRVDGEQNHVGILYLSEEDGAMMCHLAWHHMLQFDPARESYKWVDIDHLDEANKRVMAAFLQALKEEGPDVPYGFALSGECFDASGHFVPPPVGEGLTCATFVIAAFLSQGHDLIQKNTWTQRQEDASWQAHIINSLHGHATHAHIAALGNDVGAARIKPQEVVAASLHEVWPATFDDIFDLANQILLELAA